MGDTEMKEIICDSSNIKTWKYDEQFKMLYVGFHNGTTYSYFDVPLDVHTGAVLAESIGKYFNKYVRGGGFKYEKVL